MIDVDLQQLVNALDAPTRGELEGTAERCVSRGSSKILVEDLLLALLERPDGMLARALLDAEVRADELAGFLHPPVEQNATRSPAFSAELVQWLQDALLIANLDLGQSLIDQPALILPCCVIPCAMPTVHTSHYWRRLISSAFAIMPLSNRCRR